MIANRGEKDTFIVRNIVIIGFILIALAVFGIHLFLKKQAYLADRIYPNVYIDGRNVGEKSKDEVMKVFNKRNEDLKSTHMMVLYHNEPIATFEATALQVSINGKDMVDRAFLIGRTPNASTRIYQKLSSLLKLAKFEFSTSVQYDKTPVTEFIEDIEESYNKPAKNALFDFKDGRVVTFRQEEKGLKLNSDKLLKDIDMRIRDLKQKPGNIQIALVDSVIEPEITLSEANQFGIEELIAEGQSDYSGSIPGRIHNVILAASKFNGVLIPKDKVFSFVDTIGDISALTGYQPAYIIKNGKTVLGDGGGVCQVSTTLFRAAMNAGLPIVERHAHAYRVHYYENDAAPGLDATVFAPTVDLKIKNDTPSSILILTAVDEENNKLTFKMYGKKDNRSVEISKPVVSNNQPPPPPAYQDDPTLKKGVVKQVDWSAPGARATFNYKVTRDNQTIISDTFVSAYRPWQAVFLVGQAD